MWVTAPGSTAEQIETGLFIVQQNTGSTIGGTVEYPISPAAVLPTGYTITVMRVLPVIQETEFINQGRIQAESIEDGLDRLTMMIQQLTEEISRAIKVTVDNTEITDIDSLLLVLESYIAQAQSLLEEVRDIRDYLDGVPSGFNRFRVDTDTMKLIMSFYGESTSDELFIEDGDLILKLNEEDQSIGTIGMVWRGDFNDATTYPFLSLVRYEGSTYICIAENGVTGILPTDTSAWSEAAKSGTSSTISIYETKTLEAGQDAYVNNIGTASDASLSIGIPMGPKGDRGDALNLGKAFATLTELTAAYPQGSDTSHVVTATGDLYIWDGAAWVVAGILAGVPGSEGKAATITVGTTATGEAGTSVSVTNSGTENAAVFNFTIPRGEQGIQGEPGSATVDTAGAIVDSGSGIKINIAAENSGLQITDNALSIQSATTEAMGGVKLRSTFPFTGTDVNPIVADSNAVNELYTQNTALWVAVNSASTAAATAATAAATAASTATTANTKATTANTTATTANTNATTALAKPSKYTLSLSLATTTNYGCYYGKTSNGLVWCVIGITLSINITPAVTLATLPSGFRPASKMYFPATMGTGAATGWTTVGVGGTLYVTTAGVISTDMLASQSIKSISALMVFPAA